MTMAFIYRAPVAEESREGTSRGVKRSDAEKFGPLKAVLGGIPALCANRTVRP